MSNNSILQTPVLINSKMSVVSHQIFIEHLLCAGHILGAGDSRQGQSQSPRPRGLHFTGTEQTNTVILGTDICGKDYQMRPCGRG